MSETTKKVRWGVVGAGKIAHAFVSDLAFANNAAAYAIASRSMERAGAFARMHSIPRAYGSYDAIFQDPDVDMIYVATPHNFHFGNSRDAIRAGKGVLCEKPLTTSPKEALQLFDEARRSGTFLAEAMWTHFLPAIRKARQWVREGRIGEVAHIRADFGTRMDFDPDSRLYNPELAGGCLLDVGIYPISLAHLMLQESPKRVEVVSRIAPTGVEDDLAILFEYQNATASFGASFRCTLPNAAVLVGESGRIEIPDFWKAGECTLYQNGNRIDHFSDHRTSIGFNYEAESVGSDWLAKKRESEVVSWASSMAFQEQMELVRKKIGSS